MASTHVTFRVDMALSQQFKSVVTRSYLHRALLSVAQNAEPYTTSACGRRVNVYVVSLDTVNNPTVVNQLMNLIKQNFKVKQFTPYNFYVS